jgi:signal transduction histidine kinase
MLLVAASLIAAGGVLGAAVTWVMCRPRMRGQQIPPVIVMPVNQEQLEQENQRVKRDVSRYANIINSSLNPIWLRDEQLNIIYCNLAFSEIAEDTTDHVVAIGDVELFNGHRKLAQKAWDSGLEQIERRHVIVDGDRRLYKIREVPLRSDGIIVGYASDQRELEDAHNEIQRHVAALRDLLGSSTSAMAIYGRDMKLKLYNYAFVALWKLDESWLDTQPTYGDVLESLREKRKLPEQANFAAFKRSQLSVFKDIIEPQEEFFYLPDGKTVRAIAIPHALGGVLFAYEDVTDRLALERSYNTLIAVQRETLDNLYEGIVVFGENGRLKLCNPTFLKIWDLPEDISSSEPHLRDVLDQCREYFDASVWESLRQNLIARLQQRQYAAIRLERTDNRVVDCISVPLPDGATLMTFTDVTDSTVVERSLREKNEALEAADRMKTEFLASVSYELRSPLTSISGFAEMLKLQYVGQLNEVQNDYVNSIFTSAKHLSDMISDIIDLASMEAGYLTLDTVECSVSEMLEAVEALLAERMRIQDIQILHRIDADASVIIADKTRLKQILFNLISSAVKIAKQKGTITVTVESDVVEGIRVIVAVEGRSVSGDAQGLTGNLATVDLGLSVARRFVELHGGSLALTGDAASGASIECNFPKK